MAMVDLTIPEALTKSNAVKVKTPFLFLLKRESFYFAYFRFNLTLNKNCNYISPRKVYTAIITLPGGNSFFICRHSFKQICLLNFQESESVAYWALLSLRFLDNEYGSARACKLRILCHSRG